MAKELRKRKPDLVFPIIHAFFGDSPSANLDSEIAVFTEQCYQKREMLVEKYGLKTPSPKTAERAFTEPAKGMDIKAVSVSRRKSDSMARTKES
jgi:hypothetical protein